MNYIDAIVDSLKHLNGIAHISESCDYIENNRTLDYLNTNPNWRDQISKSITTNSSDSRSYAGRKDLFYTREYGKGIWGLRGFEATAYGYDEVEIENDERYYAEGKRKAVLVNSYERNPIAKKTCLQYYKDKNNGRIKCEICGFDFAKVYGVEFANKIHIHHLVEISTIGEAYEVDAVNDLLPVCLNCHMIAHSKKPAYTPDEIRDMISRNK